MEQIVQCLDQLELFSDDPVKVTRLTIELRERIHQFVVELREDITEAAEDADLVRWERDDLLRQLEQICREPV